MTDHLQSETNSNLNRPSWLKLAIVGGIIAYFAIPAYFRHREAVTEKALLAKMTQNEYQAEQLDKIEKAENKREIENRAKKEAEAISKALALSALEDVAACRRRIDQLAAAQNSWETFSSELLTAKVGYSIAANEAAVNRAIEVLDRPARLEALDSKALVRKLDILAEPIQRAVKIPRAGFMLNEEIAKQIKSIANSTDKSTAVFTQSESELRALVAAIPNHTDTSLEFSLKEAIASTKQRQQSQLVEAEEQRMARLNAENEAKVIAARNEAARQIAEAEIEAEKELARIRKNTISERFVLEKKAIDQKLIAEKLAAAKLKLEHEFLNDRDDVMRYLACFTKAGFNLRGPNPPADPGPVSYTVLDEAGVTSATQNGLLYMIQALNPSVNDRSSHQWTKQGAYMDPDRWGSVDLSFPRKAHQLLRKYGKLMVEKKLLAK